MVYLKAGNSVKVGIGTNLLPKMRQKIVLCPCKTRRRSLETEFEKFYDVFQKIYFNFFEIISNDFLLNLNRISYSIKKITNFEPGMIFSTRKDKKLHILLKYPIWAKHTNFHTKVKTGLKFAIIRSKILFFFINNCQ